MMETEILWTKVADASDCHTESAKAVCLEVEGS